MISSFTKKYICDECDYQFDIEPNGACPVCIEKEEITLLIEQMLDNKDYLMIKSRIGKLDDSVVKFDLHNLTNRKRKEIYTF